MGMMMTKNSKPGNNTLPLTVDDCGKLRYDTIVRGKKKMKKKMIVYSQHSDLVPVFAKDNNIVEQDNDMLEVDEKQREIDETTRQTKAALEQIVNARLSVVQPKNAAKQSSDSKLRYKPSQLQSDSGAKERIIRMVEMPGDPLEPSKLKHKRFPRASSDSPPVPVMHSPPRPFTQQEWNKIPPCISNWKNSKGYTIPLDKRLANDGRRLQEVQINENFAKLSEALYVGEEKNREAVEVRSKVQKEMMMKEKENKEMELRVLAQKARQSQSHDGDMMRETREEKDERIRREKIREERRRERRVEVKDAGMGKRSKISRDRERDISEKVTLGMGSSNSIGVGAKVMYDERVFNQEKGMDSGFGTDDAYNIYNEGLFTCSQSALSNTLYSRPNDEEMYGGADNDEQLDKIKKTERFKVERVFTGTNERRSGRQRDNRHVEFDKEEVALADREDPFGLDQFLTEVKTGKKAIDKVGSGGRSKGRLTWDV